MKLKPALLLTLSALFATSVVYASETHTVHWGYDGHEGPEYWGELSTNFSACKSGKNQSPIDISHTVESNLPPLTWNYTAGGGEVINNGHAIQVNYKPGSTVTIDDKQYEVKQFHFHHPSENTINGKSFPLEAHIVNQSADGELAVVAVMFEIGEENEAIQSIWKQLPEKVGATNQLDHLISADDLLPKDRDYYRFNGSLTTPPCSEGVKWIVMKNYKTITKAEVKQFEETLKHPNNRPIQNVNAREVLE